MLEAILTLLVRCQRQVFQYRYNMLEHIFDGLQHERTSVTASHWCLPNTIEVPIPAFTGYVKRQMFDVLRCHVLSHVGWREQLAHVERRLGNYRRDDLLSDDIEVEASSVELVTSEAMRLGLEQVPTLDGLGGTPELIAFKAVRALAFPAFAPAIKDLFAFCRAPGRAM